MFSTTLKNKADCMNKKTETLNRLELKGESISQYN